MNTRIVASLSFALCAGAAQAAAPVASIAASSVPSLSFVQYAGSTTVGDGLINSDTLYFINEKSGSFGDSWYIFFEPKGIETVTATITFSSAITSIYTTQSGLAGTAAYEAPTISYTYANTFVGLESRTDTVSYTGNTLTFTLSAKDPGDHIRVLTAAAVPEPGTYALMAAGLLAVGFAVKRRSDNS